MIIEKILKPLVGLTLAGVFTAQAWALPALSESVTFVKLDWLSRPVPVDGGGVSRFEVQAYKADAGSAITYSGIFGTANDPTTTADDAVVNPVIYATCIEQAEYLDKGSEWYAVFLGLEGAPSHTSGISFAPEEQIITRVLLNEFGENFQKPDNSGFDTSDVSALQAMLWEAGKTGTDDLTGGVTTTISGYPNADDTASAWAQTYKTGDTAGISLFSMVRVDLSNGQFVVDTNGQDFLTYKPGGGPNIPVPAPVLLMGLGALGLYRFARRRA
jgi:hypothetical protein